MKNFESTLNRDEIENYYKVQQSVSADKNGRTERYALSHNNKIVVGYEWRD